MSKLCVNISTHISRNTRFSEFVIFFLDLARDEPIFKHDRKINLFYWSYLFYVNHHTFPQDSLIDTTESII